MFSAQCGAQHDALPLATNYNQQHYKQHIAKMKPADLPRLSILLATFCKTLLLGFLHHRHPATAPLNMEVRLHDRAALVNKIWQTGWLAFRV